MNASANVTSIEALRNFRAAMLRVDSEMQDAVTELELELRRVVDWIEHERARYWPDQVKKASDALAEARQELERCQMRTGTEEPPSCYEQKKKVERAKRRLRLAEDKVQAVRKWKVRLRHEIQELEGRISQLTNYLEVNVPRAAATLERMSTALEKYSEQPKGAGE